MYKLLYVCVSYSSISGEEGRGKWGGLSCTNPGACKFLRPFTIKGTTSTMWTKSNLILFFFQIWACFLSSLIILFFSRKKIGLSECILGGHKVSVFFHKSRRHNIYYLLGKKRDWNWCMFCFVS